jgi:hypothetical protein
MPLSRFHIVIDHVDEISREDIEAVLARPPVFTIGGSNGLGIMFGAGYYDFELAEYISKTTEIERKELKRLSKIAKLKHELKQLELEIV